MLKNKGLFDPIKRTREMGESEFTKYVEIQKQAKAANRTTDPELVCEIQRTFEETYENLTGARRNAQAAKVPESTQPPEKAKVSESTQPEKAQAFERAKNAQAEIWAKVEPKIAENPGLAQFIVDYGGAKSKYFFPWLISVYTSPSEALEMSYGAGRGPSLEWVYRTSEEDPIEDFVRNDPTFVYNRERQLFVADLVTTIQKQASRTNPAKVVDLGAGRMAWARYHGFRADLSTLKIIAYDKDKTIEAERLFPTSSRAMGINYRYGDMREALTNPVCKGANLIMLGGVASYYPMSVFEKSVIRPVFQVLKRGGVFFFDLQVECPYLLRSMSIFDWPTMLNFESSATEAIAMVEKVRKELWADGLKFAAEYALDTYNQTPSSVMITLTKI